MRPVTSFDSVVLAAITREVHALIGGRIVRVFQPSAAEIALDIRRGGQSATLLCSIHPRWARVHLATEAEAGEPSAFCQMLRTRLEGAQVVEVIQPPFERTLTLHLDAVQGRATLAAEIMGRHSNIILIQDGLIAGSLKPVPRSMSSVREVLPGRPYTPPPRDRPTPEGLAPESLSALLTASTEPLARRLSAAVLGVSPVMAKELAARGGLDPQAPAQADAGQRLWPHLQELLTRIRTGQFAPVLYYDGTEPVGYAPFPFVHLAPLREVLVQTMSEAVEAVIGRESGQSQVEEERTRLTRAVDGALTRIRKTADDLRQAVAEAEQAQALKERGELLLAYASQVPARAAQVTVPGYDDKPITIPLEPGLSAVENAQRLFKRYGKLRAARSTLAQRVRHAEMERTYLEAVRVHIEQATSPDDLIDLRRELTDEGYLRTRRMPVRGSSAPRPRAFRLKSGATILVGRSNLENDYLTFQVAASDDLWFHARGAAGAHVILRLDGRTPAKRAVQQAAAVAAYFSQARGSGTVAVDWTQRRHVRKPRGAKPGVVTYERERTLHVTPGLPEAGVDDG